MAIEVTMTELNKFSGVMDKHLGRETALDEFIPLPGVTEEEQKKRIDTCTDHDDATYWEIKGEHGHGWCCDHCGTVVQWG